MIAMVTTTVAIDDHGALQRLTEYPALQKTAMARALTRTAAWCRTRTVEAIVGNLALKASDLDGKHRFGGVTASKATATNLQARVKVTGGRIPLFRFHGKPTKPGPAARKMGQVEYRIDAGGGTQFRYKNIFVAKMKSGHVGFFRRMPGSKHVRVERTRVTKGGKSTTRIVSTQVPISEMYGPSIPHVAEQQPAFKQLLAVDAGARLELEMGRQVNFILTGNSSGGDGASGGGA